MSFTSVADFKNQLIRKGLQGILLVADYATAALTTISTTGGELQIPVGYTSLGKLHADGSERAVDVDQSDIFGWGDVTGPSRIDIERQVTELEITAIETRKKVLQVFNGVDLSAVVADANHEVTFDQPSAPALVDYRTLLLVRDINKANGLDVYFGLHFPKANFIVNGNQSIAQGDDPLSYPIKVTALMDDAAATSVREFWAGPGMAGLKTDMGFTA